MPERSPPRPLHIARAILEGFDRHYRLFREVAGLAKGRFEAGQWSLMRESATQRIDFYDQRVLEAVQHIEEHFDLAAMADEARDALWQAVKSSYITLLAEHRQPECAETFFNSVCTKLLQREYFRNAILFVRPGVATDYMDANPPSYRSYYPISGGLRATLRRIADDLGLAQPWVDLARDLRFVVRATCQAHDRRHEHSGALARPFKAEPDLQIQVLSSLFYRNKGAYLIGRVINGTRITPVAVPILRNTQGALYVDALLFTVEQLSTLFSFTRAYFLVDMEAPSAYVDFLRTLLPHKPPAELYTMVGLQKQGKTIFYRDFLHHLRHSTDRFQMAPGIRGMVMTVFTLPSFPYVFKVIKDVIPAPKDTDREQIMAKYRLVKQHDRVGRMADTWEYSQVALPRDRFTPELLAELCHQCESQVELTDSSVVIGHVYIERRMTPLNLYLQHCTDAQLDHAIAQWGDAIKDLAAANIFPGDMLYKNFGVTRLNRVVFYDYDEIEYMTDCHFRELPRARHEEDEFADEVWFAVDKRDMFPEQWKPFLLADARIKAAALKHHADLFTPAFWLERKARIEAGQMVNVYPYPRSERFCERFGAGHAAPWPEVRG